MCPVVTQSDYYCQCPDVSSRHSVRLLLSVSRRVQSSLSPTTTESVLTHPVVTLISLSTTVSSTRPAVTQSDYYYQCPDASSCHSVCLPLSVSRCVQSSLSPTTTVSVPMRPVVTQSAYYCQCTDVFSRHSVRLLLSVSKLELVKL